MDSRVQFLQVSVAVTTFDLVASSQADDGDDTRNGDYGDGNDDVEVSFCEIIWQF